MRVTEHEALAPRTTLGVGGSAQVFLEAESQSDIRTAIRYAQEHGLPLRTLGGGSNILVPDNGIAAAVLHLSCGGMRWEDDLLLVEAGASWDDVVTEACVRGMWGVENLAGIPGSVGGAVIQNIGAYGTELSSVFAYADTVRSDTEEERRVAAALDTFAYRDSVFKKDKKVVVTRVALQLRANGTPNLSYPDLALAKEQGISLQTPLEIAQAVRRIRARKFPPLTAVGTAGSFFKNPVIGMNLAKDMSKKYQGLPMFPQADGRVKIPLAWLLDHALQLKGFARGYVRLYEHQPLVLVAERGARANDVDAFARDIAARVHDAFGFSIEREVETLVA